VRVVDDLGGETDAERWLVLAAELPITRVLAGDAPGDTLEVQLGSFDAPGPGDAEALGAAMQTRSPNSGRPSGSCSARPPGPNSCGWRRPSACSSSVAAS